MCIYAYTCQYIYEEPFSKTGSPNVALTLQAQVFNWCLLRFGKKLFICNNMYIYIYIYIYIGVYLNMCICREVSLCVFMAESVESPHPTLEIEGLIPSGVKPITQKCILLSS